MELWLKEGDLTWSSESAWTGGILGNWCIEVYVTIKRCDELDKSKNLRMEDVPEENVGENCVEKITWKNHVEKSRGLMVSD